MEDILYNKKKLAIIGGGGLGRELESWINQSNLIKDYALLGFLDDNPKILEGYKNDYKIISNVDEKALINATNVIVAIADCKFKERLFTLWRNSNNFNIKSFIHSTVILAKNVNLSTGVVLCPNTLISCDTTIGEGVFINCGSQIGHDVSIGNYTTIMASVNIGGGAIIGNNVTIGTGAVILPRVKIADNIIIGAGSVVFRNVKNEGTYIGNPAKRIF